LEVLILDKEMHTPKASNRAEISFKIQLHLWYQFLTNWRICSVGFEFSSDPSKSNGNTKFPIAKFKDSTNNSLQMAENICKYEDGSFETTNTSGEECMKNP
jgi:hypothetical protein